MCGIGGILWRDGRPAASGDLRSMAARLSHRGPDGEGMKILGPAGLVHRRLAIIDPEAGVQPLSNEDGSVWVTFNGEIYNFRELRSQLEARGHSFRTASDTEVLVHGWEEWKEELLGRLRGMFALALWDEGRRTLFLARDRVGIKPLVYADTPAAFVFASELQALKALPWLRRSIDPAALDLYLHFQYVPAPRTAFREFRKLPPAHYLVVGPEGVSGPHRYWETRFEPVQGRTEAQWVEELEATLDESVKAHLVSDVPFGAFLSGGIDSGTVVALMARHLGRDVRTFSIGVEHPKMDETARARRVAEALGTVHQQEMVRPDALSLLPTLVRHYGEPFADSSSIPTWAVSRLAASKVKMVLSGDGGDELFAGYTSYPYVTGVHRPPQGASARIRFALGAAARYAKMRPALPHPAETWFGNVAYFGSRDRVRLWRPEHRSVAATSWEWFRLEAERIKASPDLCSGLQAVDLATYLPNDILFKVDVASMCHGLEVRVPLLDHKVVEAAGRIPSSLKLRPRKGSGGDASRVETKYILRRLCARLLGEEAATGPKRGFSIPVGDWLRGPKRDEVRERLIGPSSLLADYLEPAAVGTFVEEHAGGRDHGWRLWSLLFLEEFLRQEASG